MRLFEAATFAALLVGACTPAVTPAEPALVRTPAALESALPSVPSTPNRPPAPDIRVRSAIDGRPVVVELIAEGVDAWVTFEDSGDDLYTYLFMLSDRRGGSERIDERTCRARAEFFEHYLVNAVGVSLHPSVTIAKEACSSANRAVVVVGPGEAETAADSSLTFVHRNDLDPPGWYPLMKGLEYGTELWVWQLVPLAPDDPDPADKRLPKGFKIDALYWGAGLPLLLPR